jgi:MFS family permease
VLWRFSLYGFLKNQRYFEPFLYLAFLDKGLSFAVIGLLISCREVAKNLLEIPSGAIADMWGRRRAMILSFTAYVASFLLLGHAERLPLLFCGMALFGVGDAFRTGTHKAMIFCWLRSEGRLEERTRVYGYTRSWSKIGSAVSVVVAAGLVLASGSYSYVFYGCIPAYVLGVVNFLGYPRELDGDCERCASFRSVLAHLREAFSAAFRRRGLRRLVLESMGFGGVFDAAKDYLQPVLKGVALVVVAGAVVGLGILGKEEAEALSGPRQAALLVGPVFVVLHLLSALASRRAHRFVDLVGGEDRAARLLWGLGFVAFGGITVAAFYGRGSGAAAGAASAVTIGGFVFVYILQNFWRPVLVSRVDRESEESHRATVLSIESQAKSVATMIAAPALGFAVDVVTKRGPGGPFWPVGALGAVVAFTFLVTSRRGTGTPLTDAKTPAEDLDPEN